MSLFDLLIMGFFFAVVLLSFMGGFDKVASTLVGMYVGVVVAAKTYRVVAENLLAKLFPAMATYTGELVAFLLLVAFVSIALSIALSRNWMIKRLAARMGVLNNLAGGIAGIVLAFVSCILTGLLLVVFLHVMNATGELGAGPPFSDLQALLSDSVLMPVFARLVPLVAAMVTPWFPSGMPPLLLSGN
jgi:uncharacterized membrane protein required for colicin V production